MCIAVSLFVPSAVCIDNNDRNCCCCCISVLALYCCLSALCALLRICALTHVLKRMLLPAHNPQSASPLPSLPLCTLTGDHPTRGNQPKDSLITQCSTIFFFFFFFFFFFYLLEKTTTDPQCTMQKHAPIILPTIHYLYI